MGKNKSKSFLIIVVVLGILGLIASYQFVYNSYKAKAETLKSSNDVLEERVKTLKVYYDNRDTYTAKIKDMLDDTESKLKDFPADVKIEDIIMQAVYMQTNSEIAYESITPTNKEEIVSVPQEMIDSIADERFPQSIVFEQRTGTYANQVSYSELKKALEEVFLRSQRIAIDTITYNRVGIDEETGEPKLSGTIELVFFDVKGTSKEYTYPVMNEYVNGTNNIFKNVVVEDLEGAEAGAPVAE